MVKCPSCGSEGRPTGKEWDYAAFHVKSFSCPNCSKKLSAYYLKGKLSHTISRAKK